MPKVGHLGIKSHSTRYCSAISTTIVATVNGTIGNTRELYILLDTGFSSTIFSDNYFNYFKNTENSKSYYSTIDGPYKTRRIVILILNYQNFPPPKTLPDR